MPKIPKLSPNPRKNRKTGIKRCNFLRFLVIVLSFISLLSRIIYSTYATWLTVTTFDCIPCANVSAINTTSDLFVSHHSSAIFKTIRGLNIKSEVESESLSRAKRSENLKKLINSKQFMENYSQFFSTNDYIDVKQRAEKMAKEALKSLNIDLVVGQNRTDYDFNGTKNPSDSIQEVMNQLLLNYSKSNEIENQTKSQNTNQMFFGDEPRNQSQFEDKNPENSNFSVTLDVKQLPSFVANNGSNETSFEKFTYVPSNELLHMIDHLINETNDSNHFHNSSKPNEWSNDMNEMTIDIVLNDKALNTTKDLVENTTLFSDPKRQLKRLLEDPQVVNDSDYTSNELTKSRILCSEECSQFLNIELSDPSIRRWATIVITGVLYLYALVMLCIFIGSCLELVDLLVVSTFIEGAKLFAGFILIIIDSFNGKEVHFNLIDLKFNVNHRGNGWTADFSYSEYLLDIIIFFLSTILCIRVFKCFKKQPITVSIEELADTRGTYRSNHSRNSLSPIYEH